ncbi:MAG: protein-L-isoaspartate(D-aspartate) O-methyltransferase [Nitrospinaceae bacterium]
MSAKNPRILPCAGQRRKMVEEQLVNRGIKDLRIMEAMDRVPRHLFVGESLQHRAYGDYPLPIGDSQTISQPYVVAMMTEALQLRDGDRVLEIGTGSGYQTAILAELAAQVFTIERIKSIAGKARRVLGELDYMNIVFKVFDGTYGWPDQAPFDAILVTACTPEIPRVLIKQLADKGRMVVPVGDLEKQKLVVLTCNGDRISQREIGQCKFVPLVGKYGWSSPGEDQGQGGF